jgi:hypothetical protein
VGRVFSRFQNDCVAHRQGGRDFPGEHQQREIPRDDLPAHAKRFGIWHFFVHQLREPCVVVEMADREGDINIAGFADRFAVVQRFYHGQKARVFLHETGDSIKDFGAGCAVFCPFRLGFARGGHSDGNLGCGAFCDASKLFTCRRVGRCEIIAQRAPFAVDKMARNAATVCQPYERV